VADFIYYAQTANATQAHIAAIGGTLAAGGNTDGTEAGAWSTWATIASKIAETGHAADTLTIRFHPGCYWNSTADTFQSFSNLGTGTSWASITLERWEAKVTETPAYADWYPGWDTMQLLSAWEQGSISAGSFVAGSGDVYRHTSTIPVDFAAGSYVRVWGHEIGDMSGNNRSMAGRWVNALADLALAGDFQLTNNATVTVYIKTGEVGVSPTQKWGAIAYATYINRGEQSLGITNCKGLTIRKMQTNGGRLAIQAGTGGRVDDITLDNYRQRMGGLSSGVLIGTNEFTDALGSNINIYDPDLDAGEAASEDVNVVTERGAQNGIYIMGNVDGVLITNPKISGYSHGQIQILPANTGTVDKDAYPANVEIRCDDISGGKCVLTGGPNYQRGLAINIALNGRIGPLRFRQMTVVSQVVGRIDWQSPYFDNTCPEYSDDLQTKFHVGSAIAPVYAFGFTYTNPRLRVIGGKFDMVGGWAFGWNSNNPADTLQMIGCLIRDSGHARYSEGVAPDLFQKHTRRVAPVEASHGTAGSAGTPQTLKNNMLVPGGTLDGFIAAKRAGYSQWADATPTIFPVFQANESAVGGAEAAAGAVDWTSARLSGNQSGTVADFDFDADLNYIGPRRTPIQTGSRAGRGYL
jgi:hypothetical protein